MSPVARTTAAIVVVYRLDADPDTLIEQLRTTVLHTIVVDNAPEGHPALANLRPLSDVTVLSNRNHGGLAGAYNRACGHLLLTHASIRQIVLLDEDSDASALRELLADPAVQALLHSDTTAAVAPAYRDRATGLRGKHIQLQRWQLHYLPRQFDAIEPVSFVINSMSVWRVAALRTIGLFNEGLRIDHVDTEYCLRARGAGLNVYVAGAHEFAHSIGERKRFTLFGREMQAGGHAPQRRYLIGRNTAWLARRYLWREPAFAFLCLTRLAYEVVGITLAETHRPAKLAALLRGAVAGLFTRHLE
ncbi:glycosyltransferase family 2 protein [Aquabacterium sp.]|uniref:glycosyltransferase family 2 protein n=1 Tax=Aquabacterium sp. TaxID=1872578 RepID=UPI002C98EC32|nr:glycosyltransferase family 2 protein [Aquabacterium sp.]HSW04852.1 glycosyltransferase family 2 protein [Aquabacterium sp.]